MDQYNQANMQNANIPNLNPVTVPSSSQMNHYGHPPPSQQAPVYGSSHVPQQTPPVGMMPPHPSMPYGNGQQMPPLNGPQHRPHPSMPYGNGHPDNSGGGYGKRNRNRY